MTIMWILLLFTFMFSFLSRYYSVPIHNGPLFIKPNKLMKILVVFSLVLVSGLRSNIGDTFFYMHGYEIGDFTFESVMEYKDYGFGFLQMFLKSISDDSQILIFVTALITNLLIVSVLFKYSRIFELSIYVFITSGMFTTSMNGIRQYLASAIVFAATKYLLNGNIVKYFILIIIASTFHLSALVLLPIYFIVRREAWTKVSFILLIFAVFIVIGFNQFSEILFATIDNTQYGHYRNFSEGGTNLLRIAVYSVPLIFAFLGREKLKMLWPKSDYIVNLSIISFIFIIISSQNWIFARFNIYFDLYNLILISWIVKLFTERDGKLIYYTILIFYFIFYFYEHVIVFGLVYKSNYFQI